MLWFEIYIDFSLGGFDYYFKFKVPDSSIDLLKDMTLIKLDIVGYGTNHNAFLSIFTYEVTSGVPRIIENANFQRFQRYPLNEDGSVPLGWKHTNYFCPFYAYTPQQTFSQKTISTNYSQEYLNDAQMELAFTNPANYYRDLSNKKLNKLLRAGEATYVIRNSNDNQSNSEAIQSAQQSTNPSIAPMPLGKGTPQKSVSKEFNLRTNQALAAVANPDNPRYVLSFRLNKQVSFGGPTGDGSQGDQVFYEFAEFWMKDFSSSFAKDEVIDFEIDAVVNNYETIDFTNGIYTKENYNANIILNGVSFNEENGGLSGTVYTNYGGETEHYPQTNRFSWNIFHGSTFDLYDFSYKVNDIERVFNLNEGDGSPQATNSSISMSIDNTSWIRDVYGTGLQFNNTFEATWNDTTPFIFEEGAHLNFKARLKIKDFLPLNNYWGTIGHIDYEDPISGDLYQLEITAYQTTTCESEQPCIPQVVAPVSCITAYQTFLSTLSSIGDTEQLISEEEFCQLNYAYITADYANYLSALGVTNTASLHYTTIGIFGNTQYNYGYDAMQTVINAYASHVSSNAGNTEALQTWTEFTSTYYNEQTSNGTTCVNVPAPLITNTENLTYPNMPSVTPCTEFAELVYNSYTEDVYQNYLKKERQAFISGYLNNALNNVVENFEMTYSDKEYQYTLYYYDQAGNLIQTVPPQGVDRFTATELDAIADGETLTLDEKINAHRATNHAVEAPSLLPDHTYKTHYSYNSLNQLVWQFTPDGGETRFAYDALGRIIASQNAKQLLNNTFSYTTYDALGRIIEAGELIPTISMAIENTTGKLIDTTTGATISMVNFPNAVSDVQNEVSKTLYSVPLDNADEIFDTVEVINHQLKATARNRVTAIYYYDQITLSTDAADYNNALFYNYDIHGNVKEMAQDMNVLDPGNNRLDGIRRVQYQYDLISGNVISVSYQLGREDQFIHQYNYDADNRITQVQTSSDGLIWEIDATYDYYKHGPLARTILGDNQVQGLDYAYTLHGWLKGVNSDAGTQTNDLGNDGPVVAQDAFGYALSYYENDYTPVGTINNAFDVSTTGPQNPQNLYNGNIKQMTSAIWNTDKTTVFNPLNHYQYDQLNRITSMQNYDMSAGAIPGINSSYQYDRNGNLTALTRAGVTSEGTPQEMDNLSYHYKTKLNPNTGLQEPINQLDHVVDTFSEPVFNDIGTQTAGNYTYDAIGQLTSDLSQGITHIDWRVDGKVSRIVKNDESEIVFKYNGLGNRISKTLFPQDSSTVYALDAQSNVLAVYKAHRHNTNNYKVITLKEHHIYGSSRLGIEQKSIEIPVSTAEYLSTNEEGSTLSIRKPIDSIFAKTIGDKRYELSNHLGNVLSVVSDRKIVKDPLNFTTFEPDVLLFNDYYPFGQLVPNRYGSSDSYRYGFQGQEKDDEVKGEGNSLNFTFRMHDPRVGRFFAVDPLTHQYPWYTPYSFSGNKVIAFVELEGKEEVGYLEKWEYSVSVLVTN